MNDMGVLTREEIHKLVDYFLDKDLRIFACVDNETTDKIINEYCRVFFNKCWIIK